jgi:AraC-like DNA-binding protein
LEIVVFFNSFLEFEQIVVIFAASKRIIRMTGPLILIAAIIIVFVIAFVVTMLFVNAQTSKIIDVNVKLAESQHTLLSQNKTQTDLLQKLEEQAASQHRELDIQQRELEELHKRLEGLASSQDMVNELQQQTHVHRQKIKATQDMTDEELMAWLDERMDETRLYTSPTLSLKEAASALGLTQRRLGQLFKNNEKFANLSDYLTEKRFLLACELMRNNPEWTIEAVSREAGFLTRRKFQDVVKAHLGLTPSQFRQSMNNSSLHKHTAHRPSVDDDDTNGGNLHRQVGQVRPRTEYQERQYGDNAGDENVDRHAHAHPAQPTSIADGYGHA